ncbi:nitrite reductase [Vibrio amylolyticus]|uniref:TPR domain-containing protein n=1 Tax=Vibrio amylolyticus TaxID=2847292 RepID=UPI00355346C5
MESIVLVTLILLSVSIAIVFSQKSKQRKRKASLFMVVVTLTTLPLFYFLHEPAPKALEKTVDALTHSEYMEDIQAKLTEDPNQQELWFQLGHGYLVNNDFKSALTSFDYSIRLSASPSANQLAAKASALYYLRSQRINDEVESLLTAALQQDSTNTTALTLIANDHLLSFRYQQAIDTWVRLLDSQKTDLDRVAIIGSINYAKSRLNIH